VALNDRILTKALLFLAFTGAWLIPEPCDAQTVQQLPMLGTIHKVPYYEVQVLYVCYDLDPDLYAWDVVMETSSYDRAIDYYEYLLLARETGALNDVAPPVMFWNMVPAVAVDVVMVTKYRYVYVRN